MKSSASNGVDSIRCFTTAMADQDCDISEVYVELNGEEVYMKKESTTNTDSDGNVYNSERDVRTYEILHYKKKIAVENIRLEENDSEKWLTSFEFPAQVTPTYHGKNAHFK